jgi:hypothetical protein
MWRILSMIGAGHQIYSRTVVLGFITLIGWSNESVKLTLLTKSSAFAFPRTFPAALAPSTP